jgi:hypothetical protein
MRRVKFVAIVMALNLCLPALTWARGTYGGALGAPP